VDALARSGKLASMDGFEPFEPVERFCPACMKAIDAGEPTVFFEREMYHLDCVPGTRHSPSPREPRF
jgi:hypothetical protein